MGRQKELEFGLGFLVLVSFFSFGVESSCSRGCDLAYASYDVWTGSTLTIIAQIFQTSIDDILKRNPQVANQDSVQAGARIEVPFSCDCINATFLGHVSSYKVNDGDTYYSVATKYYSNLTTVEWLQRFNSYPPTRIPATANLTVVVNCSCGDRAVSNDYGLFLTYPLRPGESLRSVARNFSLSDDLLQRYNRNSKSLLYVPVKDGTGSYVPLRTSSAGGISGGAIAGVCIGVVAAILLAAAIYIRIHRKKREKEAILLLASTEGHSNQAQHGPFFSLFKPSLSSVD